MSIANPAILTSFFLIFVCLREADTLESTMMLSAIVQVLILAVLSSLHNVLAQTISDPPNLNASIKEVKVEAGGIRYEISASAYSAYPFDPSIIGYFGVRFMNTSTTFATWHDFMLTAVEVQEYIYYNYGNQSENLAPVENFRWAVYPPQYSLPLAYNISAVGRGLEPNTAVTLSYPRLVLFTRWMVQIARHPWTNNTFECSFGLRGPPGQPIENVPVATGWFAPYNWTGSYDPSEQAPLILKPQGPQTS